MLKIFLNATVIALFSISAQALPILKKGAAPPKFPTSFTANHDFEGIVALSNCSGGLFQLENSKDTDKAMVLTNGHCLESGFIAPGRIVYGESSSRRFQLFNSLTNKIGSLNAQKIIYATMTKTDMAIYKLRETYGEIKSRYKVNPLVLSSKKANLGAPIEILSGYWSRGYACNIESFVTKLQEGAWHWEDSLRFSRPGCETIPGTSGSPVILAGTHTIVGVNNTGNEDGQRCSDNNPCEIDSNGNVTYQEGLSYAQQTFWVYGCMNTQNEFDILTPGCVLPR